MQAQDLPVSLRVHTGRDRGMAVHRPPGLTDLQHQRVRGHERVGPGVQWPGPEHLHLRAEIPGDLGGTGAMVAGLAR